jgi:hypothetical protein
MGHYRLQNKISRHNVDDFRRAAHNSNDKQKTLQKGKQEHEVALVMMVMVMESTKLHLPTITSVIVFALYVQGFFNTQK